MHLDRVYKEVKEFARDSRDQHFHIIFSDFEGMLPKDDSAPRKLTALMRDCHTVLEDTCTRYHHHGPGERCWITALNYFADPTLIGPNIPREQRMKTGDRLNLLRSSLGSAQSTLTHLHLIDITAYITADMSKKFFMDSGVPREQLKDWLCEKVRKDVQYAFHFTV